MRYLGAHVAFLEQWGPHMKTLIRNTTGLVCCLAFAQSATAQSTEDFAQLQERVNQLEAQQNENLDFNLGNTTIDIYGFVRAEAFYDFDFAQGDLSRAGRVGDPAFDTNGEFDTSVRVSRFGIRSSTDTDIGAIGTQLEFDLFGSGGDDSSSPNLRLRHANITIGDSVLVGQFWTNFMPLVHYPSTADFNGPVGISFARVPQFRYTYNAGNGLQFSGSIEEQNGGGSDPIVTAAAFYDSGNYSLRAAALVGEYSDDVDDDLTTYGYTLSGSVQPWQGGTLTATFTSGEGLGNLLIGGGARSVGGEENESDSFTVAYNQDLNDQFSLALAYGYEEYDLGTAIGSLAEGEIDTRDRFDELQSVHATLFYRPVENLTLAAEYIYIESSGADFDADADRIGLSATYSF